MVQALYKKEILDILRDKKTMLITVLVPLILYPLLFLGGLLAVSMVVSNQQSATYRVVFVDVSEQSAIESVMKEGEKELGYYFETVQDTGDWEQQLKKQNIDICILQKKKESKLHMRYNIYHRYRRPLQPLLIWKKYCRIMKNIAKESSGESRIRCTDGIASDYCIKGGSLLKGRKCRKYSRVNFTVFVDYQYINGGYLSCD